MIPEDLERKMYWKTKNILEKEGYFHYEISNFAKKGFESNHNLSCWNQDEYIGFGMSAHSYLNKKRFSNIENLDEYIENIENNNFEKNLIIQENTQSFEQQAKEYMMIGLRKIKGVSISEFEQKFQINPLFYFRFEISKLEEEGLLEVDLDNIRLTKKGLDFANVVFEEFV
jgi:oxygen-independent coproporphyrinogen-3 oxidase